MLIVILYINRYVLDWTQNLNTVKRNTAKPTANVNTPITTVIISFFSETNGVHYL